MSHPSEASLSSRELAERIRSQKMDEHSSRPHLVSVLSNEESVALIDTWVRARETEARLDESTIWWSIIITSHNFPERAGNEYKARIDQLKSALATARKRLEEKS